ncbi:hypothetical protein JD969_13030 [Planctomycetota bacterium]|nr:hypothetical protein JD969_13030 [Planctomycetota bacterium]
MDQLAKYERMMRRLSASMLKKYEGDDLLNDGNLPWENPGVGIGAPAGRMLVNDKIAKKDIQGWLAGLKVLASVTEDSQLYGKCSRFDDTLGFTRPCYHPMLVHLHWAAMQKQWEKLSDEQREQGNELAETATKAFIWLAGYVDPNKPIPNTEVELVLMGAACLNWLRDKRAIDVFGDAISSFTNGSCGDVVDILVTRIISQMGDDGEMRPFDADSGDLLDAWWYRELVSLHGLTSLSVQTDRIDWTYCCKRVADHHLRNTQPDHTTAQPWGVATYASDPNLFTFADQQLHDCEANWHLTRGGSGVVAALVLADAAFAASQMLR